MSEAKSPSTRFWREAHGLYKASSTTEKSYYPLIKELWSRLLEDRGLPFEVRAETSQQHSGTAGADFPDLALYDHGEFVTVFGEVKLPGVDISEMAASVEHGDQVGRYLAQTGVMLLTNVRSVGLLACKPGYVRVAGKPVPPDKRDLLVAVALWPPEDALANGKTVSKLAEDALGDLLARIIHE